MWFIIWLVWLYNVHVKFKKNDFDWFLCTHESFMTVFYKYCALNKTIIYLDL